MSDDIILDNEWMTLRYYPVDGIIHHTWKKNCSGQVFREMMLGASEYLGSHKGSKWLSDDRHFTVMTEEDSLWGRSVWFEKTIHAGWKHWAILLPERHVGQESMQMMVNEYRAVGINAKVFSTLESAMDWLRAQ